MYLNEIYYGNLVYGIEAAAQTYFGKPAAELSLAEAAFLAGLPQSPIELNPYVNFEGARERQRMILELMAAEGMIDAATLAAALESELALAPLIPVEQEVSTATLNAPHFVLYAQQELEARYGPDALIHGGWQITTSLDLGIQEPSKRCASRSARAATTTSLTALPWSSAQQRRDPGYGRQP